VSRIGARFRESTAGVVAISREMPTELRARWAVKGRVLISMLQILSLLSSAFSIRWPWNYSSLLGGVGALANLNPVGMLGLSCDFVSYDWHAALLQTTILPLVITLLLLATRHAIMSMRKPVSPASSPGVPSSLGCSVGCAPSTGSSYFTKMNEVLEEADGDEEDTVAPLPKPRPEPQREPMVARWCATGVSTLLLLVYPRMCAAIFAAFNCEEFDVGKGMPKLRYLHEDLSIDCNSPEHRAHQGYALVMIAIYPVGVPAVLAVLLWRARKPMRELAVSVREGKAARDLPRFAAMRNGGGTALPAGGAAGGPAGGASLGHTSVSRLGRAGSDTTLLSIHTKLKEDVKTYAWLKPVLGGYRPQYYWYELLECVRKLALVGLLIPIGNGGVAQLVAGSLIAAMLLCVLCAARPYQLKSDNMLAIACQATVFLTLQLAMYLRLEQLNTRHELTYALKAEDDDLEAQLKDHEINTEAGVGIALIGVCLTPCFLGLLLVIYEAPRAWRSAMRSATEHLNAGRIHLFALGRTASWRAPRSPARSLAEAGRVGSDGASQRHGALPSGSSKSSVGVPTHPGPASGRQLGRMASNRI
jgi:hypothetical protein